MKAVKSLILAAVLIAAGVTYSPAEEPADSIAAFHAAVHKAFGMPEPVIVQLSQQGLPPDEIPAIALISTRAKVEPARVVELRKSGLSYVQVSQKLGVGPEVFYVPFESDPGPQFTRVYTTWKTVPKEQWSTVTLSDDEVVGLSNVQLITNTYKVPAARAIELHAAGKDYVVIHNELAGAPLAATVTTVPAQPGTAVVVEKPAPPAQPGMAVVVQKPTITQRDGYEIRGHDYTDVRVSTLAACQQTCANEDRCRAYTYNTAEQKCFLKDVIGEYSPRTARVSGEKTG